MAFGTECVRLEGIHPMATDATRVRPGSGSKLAGVRILVALAAGVPLTSGMSTSEVRLLGSMAGATGQFAVRGVEREAAGRMQRAREFEALVEETLVLSLMALLADGLRVDLDLSGHRNDEVGAVGGVMAVRAGTRCLLAVIGEQ